MDCCDTVVCNAFFEKFGSNDSCFEKIHLSEIVFLLAEEMNTFLIPVPLRK